jgi:hypothetical protein
MSFSAWRSGEHAGGVGEQAVDSSCGGERLVEIAALSGHAREVEPAPDHVAVHRRKESVRHLRAALSVVEDVDRIERQLRIEEVRTHRGVRAGGRGEVRGRSASPDRAGARP